MECVATNKRHLLEWEFKNVQHNINIKVIKMKIVPETTESHELFSCCLAAVAARAFDGSFVCKSNRRLIKFCNPKCSEREREFRVRRPPKTQNWDFCPVASFCLPSTSQSSPPFQLHCVKLLANCFKSAAGGWGETVSHPMRLNIVRRRWWWWWCSSEWEKIDSTKFIDNIFQLKFHFTSGLFCVCIFSSNGRWEFN